MRMSFLQPRFLLVLCLPGLLLSASAQTPDTPEEVFLGELVFPQEAGELQVTASPYVAELGSTLFSGLGLEVGLTDAWQIEAAWTASPFAETMNHEVEVGSQVSWIDLAESGVHAALGLEAEWEGSEFEGLAPFAVLATEIGAAHVFLQGAARIRTDADEGVLEDNVIDPDDDERWAVGAGLTWPVGPVFVTTEASVHLRGATHHLTAAPGIVAPLSDGWQLGVGLPITNTRSRPSIGLAAFLTYEFELSAD